MALAPIPLASQAYQLTSRPGAAHRLLNLYAEKLPEGSRSAFMLKSAPGLRVNETLTDGPVYAMEAIPGFMYVVAGSHFYRVYADATPTVDLGDITETAAPSIAIGPSQVVVVNPPNAYIADHTGTLSQITTGVGNFPTDGASSVTYLDGYFIFTSFTGDYFFVSQLLSGSVFDGLDYAVSQRRPDYVQHGIAHNGELWLFGQDASSVQYNSGDADFPFRERAGSILQQGLGSSQTLAPMDGSLWWLGNDRLVYRSNGYRAVRVSTHPIEELLAQYGDLRDITGLAFMFEGHAFYALNLPSAAGGSRSFIYDASTQMWHERSSDVTGLGRWRGNAAVHFGPYLFIGDSVTGDIHELDTNEADDNGVVMKREAVLPPIVTHGPRAFMSRLEVEMEVGTADAPGTISLDWSDDGGWTWTTPRSLSTGALTALRTRVASTRLGSFRQRVLRLTAAGKTNIYGVDVDMQKGEG